VNPRGEVFFKDRQCAEGALVTYTVAATDLNGGSVAVPAKPAALQDRVPDRSRDHVYQPKSCPGKELAQFRSRFRSRPAVIGGPSSNGTGLLGKTPGLFSFSRSCQQAMD
jgi:hypothetical protein